MLDCVVELPCITLATVNPTRQQGWVSGWRRIFSQQQQAEFRPDKVLEGMCNTSLGRRPPVTN